MRSAWSQRLGAAICCTVCLLMFSLVTADPTPPPGMSYGPNEQGPVQQQAQTNTFNPSFCSSNSALWSSHLPDSCRSQLWDNCKRHGGTVCYIPPAACGLIKVGGVALGLDATSTAMVNTMCQYAKDYDMCLQTCLPSVGDIRTKLATYMHDHGVDNDCHGQSVTDQICGALGGANAVNKEFDHIFGGGWIGSNPLGSTKNTPFDPSTWG